MNLHESFKDWNTAKERLDELVAEGGDVKKIDLRSNQGGYKLIFRTQEPEQTE